MVKKDGLILEKNLRVREDWWVLEDFITKRIIYNIRKYQSVYYILFILLQHQCHTLNTGSLSASAG